MSKTDIANGKQLCSDVQQLLDDKCKQQAFALKVSGCKSDDDWTVVVVTPTKAGIRAYDYAEILSKVEGELQAKGYEHVLIVPAFTD
jgi:hypothetical protein